ncbi:MAG: hypothetical protein ACU0BS_08960 [Hasllibacter sp.]
MDPIELLRWAAALLTIAAACCVSFAVSDRVTAWGFVLFSLASACWIGAGLAQGLPALTMQNAVLLTLNLIGVRRWFARAGRAERAA